MVTRAARFLTSFGRALSAAALYQDGHPTLERAVNAAWEHFLALVAVVPQPTFTFLGSAVLFGELPLPNQRQAEWCERLAGCGLQRVEFDSSADREEFVAFLSEVAGRLAGQAPESAAPGPYAPRKIRFGAVGLRDNPAGGSLPAQTATLAFTLDAEVDTTRWVHREAAGRRAIPIVEVEAVVQSLSVAMHSNAEMVLPLVQLSEFDQYTTTHSLNVSVLAMGLAERLGFTASLVRALGIAGLLHDVGKTLIPLDILTKPGRLTESERETMNRHPVDGAQLILRSDAHQEIAAVVAYEHHVGMDGSGYPAFRYQRPCHVASRLVHVCDVFDALRTHRPYRDAWSLPDACAHLRARSGIEFDPTMVEPFVAMVRQSPQPVA